MPFPSSVRIRLCLIEDLTDTTIDKYVDSPLEIPLEFFESHEQDTIRHIDTKSSPESFAFFAKWARPATQSSRNSDIEDWISKGRPYNIDINSDPHKVRLNHERYCRRPGTYRPYCHIGATPTDMIRAATECTSLYWRNVNDNPVGMAINGRHRTFFANIKRQASYCLIPYASTAFWRENTT